MKRGDRSKKCESCGLGLYRAGKGGRPPERFCTPECRLKWWGKRSNRRVAAERAAVGS